MRIPNEARTYRRQSQSAQLGRAQLDRRPRLRIIRTFDLAPLQHLQPGGPGVFPTGRYEVTPCEGASPLVAIPRVETLGSVLEPLRGPKQRP